jgi:hypothetical protein
MLGVAPAWAESMTFQALLNTDGSGRLIVNDESEPEWQSCKPDLSACSPFATGQEINTDGAPPETVFWDGEDKLSPVWYGNVSAVTAPSVSGDIRANEIVIPIPGEWRGGWEGDHNRMQLSACASPTGEDCIAFLHSDYVNGLPDGAALIDPAFTGRYLRVANRRSGAGIVFVHAEPWPYPREAVWPADTLTSVAIAGQIAPATHPLLIDAAPPPLIRAWISKRGVATVRCEGLACRAVLIAGRKGRRARTVRELPAINPDIPVKKLPRLRLRHRARIRLGSGRIRMTVKVNGTRAARRTLVLGKAVHRRRTSHRRRLRHR